ncbi:type I polyketide synthase [Pseudomonas hunanensis]|uniref:type I polyketide synthase n=1 Tax=Pseudomonas hunanensis TaxID=1247546 RepID=UPI002405930C|nr:type I polyketide synthase [Pseudomonas hunanensis]MDF9756303.1 acyl transferase domain-containing protein/aryl carrier-like protein [Pseudomonas hunanensis]
MNPSMDNAVAIIGMACRLPFADNPEQFWQALAQGQEAIESYSDEQLRERGVPAERLADPHFVRAGVPLPGRQLFDAGFFGFSPRDASLMDPQQRLLLETAWHAFERAGLAPERNGRETGVFVGADASSYFVNNLLPNAQAMAGTDPVQLLYANSGNATQIAYKLNLRGPALDIATACSTSLVAIHQACRSLLLHECDMALAGGASVQAAEQQGYLHRPDSILSPDGHCRPFDQQARGTVAGQGVALVLLKRYEDAVRDNDRIEAVIRGSAINNDGARKVGYTAPSIDGQVAVLRRALAMAGLQAPEVGYIECHGTGTALGDPIELTALDEVYGGQPRATDAPCYLGSLKSNLGHLNAAAGAAGLIKAVLCLQQRQIPASLHFTRLTDKASLHGLQVNARLRPWPAADRIARAAVSSFGIGGTNAHVLLEAAPPRPASQADAGPRLLTLSAKSADAVARKQAQLADWLERNPEAALADVCHTANRRSQQVHRLALLARSGAELLARLREGTPARLAAPPPTDLVLVLRDGPGLVEGVAALAAHCRPVACALAASADAFGPDAGLAQRGFAALHALAGLWHAWGLRPHLVLCDALGELAMACQAGRLTLGDAARLLAGQASEVSAPRAAGGEQTGTWLSSLDGKPVSPVRPLDADYWRQPRDSAQFSASLARLAKAPGHCLVDAAALPWPQACAACLDSAQATLHEQLLDLAGQLWARGVALDLDAMHDGQGQRVVLPGYPFERSRHWIDAPRKALAAPASASPAGDAAALPEVLPRNELEREIAGFWSELLGIEQIGVTEDFFDLGGHSLLATQLNARIHQRFGVELSLEDLFDHPTVEATVNLLLRSEAAVPDTSH